MVEIKAGNIYECPDLKSGQGQKGEWAMFKVKAKKGYDNVIVWASNAANIKGATAVKVVKIDNVKLGAHESNGQWYKDYSITATLERAESGRQGAGSSQNIDEFMTASSGELESIFGF